MRSRPWPTAPLARPPRSGARRAGSSRRGCPPAFSTRAAGRVRILVMRAREQGERTAARLVALGHAPLLAPLIEVRPTGQPPPAGPFAAALLTSAHAVAPLAETKALCGLPVFAVGARTAAA